MAESNAPEHQDRALFGLIGKKKEEAAHQQHGGGVDTEGYGHAGDVHPVPPHGTHQQQQYSSGVDPQGYGHAGDVHTASHVHSEEPKYHGEGEKFSHEGRMGGSLNRSNSSSSSSSSDEEGGEKGEKKKKKGGLKEKLAGHKKEGEVPDEKKEGFLEKVKEKLPGQKKEGEQYHAPATATYGQKKEGEQYHAPATATYGHTEESAEKKGLMDKIKEKLPGHQKKEEKGQY